jgi:hypothetical protein
VPIAVQNEERLQPLRMNYVPEQQRLKPGSPWIQCGMAEAMP